MTSVVVCSEEAMRHLGKKDKGMAAVMERIGPIQRAAFPDPFTSLLRSTVSQQISKAAAASVWARVNERFNPLTPEGIVAAAEDEMRQCGLSFRKVEYMKGISEAALAGELDRADLEGLSDDEVIARLTALRGVGIWTAEMFLIFTLGRPDVVSWGDLAIRRGMAVLYGYETLTKELFQRHRDVYSPWGSTASLYLWEVASENPVKGRTAKRRDPKGPVTM